MNNFSDKFEEASMAGGDFDEDEKLFTHDYHLDGVKFRPKPDFGKFHLAQDDFGTVRYKNTGSSIEDHKGWRPSDEKIKEEVCETLYQNPDFDASEIEVSVEEGCVSLIGYVEDRETKRLAERLIENIVGVHDVLNELRIDRELHS